MKKEFHNGKVVLLGGDCLEVLDTLSDNSVDSVVTDAPYHLASIVKRFGKEGSAPAKFGTDGAYARASSGFMNKEWDGGDIAFRPETWAKMLRVLKPGGYLLAFGASRNFHRMAVAIEDGGFEIRDTVMWLYGTGFPKSHDIEKAINKIDGVEFEETNASGVGFMGPEGPGGYNVTKHHLKQKGKSSERAAKWKGFGTALKPAYEPVIMARKMIEEKSIAENVLKHGTGCINIDGCRIDIHEGDDPRLGGNGDWSGDKLGYHGSDNDARHPSSPLGRFPANVMHDGSEEVVAAFPDSKGAQGAVRGTEAPKQGTAVYGDYGKRPPQEPRGDQGSAARFFYSSKANGADRLASKHPTVKPLDLMRYLVRMVTPPGGTVLDPFAGTGSTGEAALKEGMKAILIEREVEYQRDIEDRMNHAFDAVELRKAKNKAAKKNVNTRTISELFK